LFEEILFFVKVSMMLMLHIFFVALVFGKDGRIVGGIEVEDTTSFPWLVAIISRNATIEADNDWYNKSDYY